MSDGIPSLSLGADTRPRGDSTTSHSTAPNVDKEQLAQALDKIHNTASHSDTLTTFNDFAAPPVPVPVAETKGISGDLVHQGLSGLYSRIRDAVGGVAGTRSGQELDDAEPDDAASKKSLPSNTAASKASAAAAPVSLLKSTPTRGKPEGPVPGSSSKVLPKQGMPGHQSLPSATQALAAIALDAGVSPALPTRDGGSLASIWSEEHRAGPGNRRGTDRAGSRPPGHDLENTLDAETLDSRPLSHQGRMRREDGLSIDGNMDSPLSPVKSPAPSVTQASETRISSAAPSISSLASTARLPTVIDRISRPRSPTFEGTHSPSMEHVTAEPSQINTSAHNSVYHESFALESQPQQNNSGSLRIPGTTINEGAPEQVNARLEMMRKQVLSKEFWMADETCKECFLCGNVFTAFRRKHHCRTCGCIFDSQCTEKISGERFGVQGVIRVCKTCLGIINRRYDTSGSEDSADESYLPEIFRPNLGNPSRASRDIDDTDSIRHVDRPVELETGRSGTTPTPMMTIPATRRRGDSAVLEIDAPQLSRPSSSRSLKSLAGRPASAGHKRHHSKHNALSRLKGAADDKSIPFRRGLTDEMTRRSKLSAFHDDNIIDPELAAYMSDESSGDEQMSIFATMSGGDANPSSFDQDKHSLGSFLAAGKKHHPRQSNKSISGLSLTSRGHDDATGVSNHPSFTRSSGRLRAPSNVGTNMHHLRSPRPKSMVLNQPNPIALLEHPAIDSTKPSKAETVPDTQEHELNPSSLHHVKKLLHQLLHDAEIPNVLAWEKALVPILRRCTNDVVPDVRSGDDMDIRHFVKLKKIPGGKPSSTHYVSGVIFTKNLALKSMPSRITRPRVVIISFPIEYQRHQQQFMSLQPVIEQEKEYLRIIVSRIVKLNPQVLLVEKGVSGVALQYLSEANIAVVYNVKASVIEAVSRCAEADIISSIDMLSLPVRVGHCGGFEVKSFNREVTGTRKSYIFLSGCKPSLGCTIALRGDNASVLVRLKRITEFMVYVVYNLKLEMCLMRDEFIHIPTEDGVPLLPSTSRQPTDDATNSMSSRGNSFGPTVVINTTASDSEPPTQTSMGSTISQPDDTTLGIEENTEIESPGALQTTSIRQTELGPNESDSALPEDVPMPTFYSDMVARYETKILSASPFVKFTQPYLLMRAREQERRLVYLKRLRDQDRVKETEDGEKSKGQQKFGLIKPEMIHTIGQQGPQQIMEVIHAVHDAEYDKALHNYQIHTRQWETYIQGNIDLFDPFSHQNIVVLYSVTCTETKIPCVEPGLIAISFYEEHYVYSGMYPDCTLGQYIEDLCYSRESVCTANGCDKRMVEHHRTYVHDESRVTIFLETIPPETLPPPSEDIMMWNYCKLCNKDTAPIPMSESTWKYSFGKYLELLFWSRGLRLNDKADCPHDHRCDHIRYFRFNDTVVRIHYDPIDLLEIIVPRSRITWKVENDLKLKNDIFTKAEERWIRFIGSVKSRLKSIKMDAILPEKTEACKAEIEALLRKAQDDQTARIRRMQETYVNSKYYEVIPFNIVIREMLQAAGEWDAAFARFEAEFLPDKDVRQLTLLQLRKIFSDNESKESLPQTESTPSTVDTDGRPSQVFTEGDERSTQPSDFTSSSPGESPTPTKQSSSEGQDKQTKSPELGLEHTDSTEPQSDEVSLLTVPPPNVPVEELADSNWAPVPPPDLQLEEKKQVAAQGSPASETPLSAIPRPTASLTAEPLPANPKEEQNPGGSELSPTPVNPDSATRISVGESGVPKATPDRTSRTSGKATSPPLQRATSQPVRTLSGIQLNKTTSRDGKATDAPPAAGAHEVVSKPKLSDRLVDALTKRKTAAASSIPRYIPKKDKSRVSALTRHFEQITREFEKEARKKRAEKMRHRHPQAVIPRTSTHATVDVYDDVDEAVQEPGPSEYEARQEDVNMEPVDTIAQYASSEKLEVPVEEVGEAPPRTATTLQPKQETCGETEEPATTQTSHTGSDEEGASDTEGFNLDDLLPDVSEIAEKLEPTPDSSGELPKAEKTSLLKLLTNFWAERSSSGWKPLEYPVSLMDHIFIDSDVIVREDEPSSLVAFALSSDDYHAKLSDIRRQWQQQNLPRDGRDGGGSESEQHSMPGSEIDGDFLDADLESSLLRSTGTHLKYQFTDGSAKMLCKIFYAEQFDALRRKCGVADRVIESLSRCLTWDSRGGKTRAVFLKTLDDRLVLKSLSAVERDAFLEFAPSYFNIMAEALFHDLPSVIAKMVGFFQVYIKNPTTGTDLKLDLLVMENLFYDRSPGKIFDLKGSMRNRKIQSTGEQNEVLLDENMVEYIYESPLFAREHSKRLLRASVYNDTLFLARQNVMDYSLMVAIDEDKKELVVGIVDCIRTYTLDKKLEYWIKHQGFAGGGRNRPTITSPKEYKSRFREAMARYILQSPDSWHQFNPPSTGARTRFEDTGD